jgi:hypothetical protein
MQTTTDSNTRYLLADDMNLLISEVIANVEMSDATDAGYVSNDDQALIRDFIKNRIAINQEILLGHKAKQWDSVYWNSNNIRPDLTVKLLNEELSRQDNQGSDEKQIEIDSDQRRLNEFANIRFNRTVNNHDGSSGFLFGGSRCSSSDVSSSNQNSQSSYDSQSNSNREFSD